MLIYHTRKNLFVVCLVFCILASISLMPKNVAAKALSRPAEQSVVLTADRILRYDQLKGNSSWIQNSARRFMSAIWQFNSDGTFYFAPTYDARDDLFPIQGTFRVNGNTILFSGSKSSQIEYTGSASTSVEGRIEVRNGQPVIAMNWITSSGTAANIYNTPYASSSTTAYYIEATLRVNQ